MQLASWTRALRHGESSRSPPLRVSTAAQAALQNRNFPCYRGPIASRERERERELHGKLTEASQQSQSEDFVEKRNEERKRKRRDGSTDDAIAPGAASPMATRPSSHVKPQKPSGLTTYYLLPLSPPVNSLLSFLFLFLCDIGDLLSGFSRYPRSIACPLP